MTPEHKAKLQAARIAAKELQGDSPTVRKTPIEKALADPTSLRKAINAKCYECIHDPSDVGYWTDQVRACTSKSCPLYPVRPT